MNTLKTILTGTFGVGKTSLFKRIIDGAFEDKYITTIGVKVGKKEIDGKTYILWDIAGEVAQDKIPPTYFLNAYRIFYVIDLSRPNTFSSITSDIEFLKSQYSNSDLCIIGNKIDLLREENLLEERLSTIPVSCDILTSAKNGDGIEFVTGKLIK